MRKLLSDFLPQNIMGRTVSKTSRAEEKSSKNLAKRFSKFYAQLQYDRKTLMDHNRSLKNSLDIIESNINDEIREIRDVSAKELDFMRSELSKRASDYSKLKSENESLAKENRDLMSQIYKVRNFSDNLSAELKQYIGENSQLKSDLEYEKKCSSKFYSDREEKQKEINELKIINDEYSEMIKELKAKIAEMEAQNISLISKDMQSKDYSNVDDKITFFNQNLNGFFDKIRLILNHDPYFDYSSADSTHDTQLNGITSENKPQFSDDNDTIANEIVDKSNSLKCDKCRRLKNSVLGPNINELEMIFNEMHDKLNSTLNHNRYIENELGTKNTMYAQERHRNIEISQKYKSQIDQLQEQLRDKESQLQTINAMNRDLDRKLSRAEVAIMECKRSHDSNVLVALNSSIDSSSQSNSEHGMKSHHQKGRLMKIVEKITNGPVGILKCSPFSVTLCNLFEESPISLGGLSLKIYRMDERFANDPTSFSSKDKCENMKLMQNSCELIKEIFFDDSEYVDIDQDLQIDVNLLEFNKSETSKEEQDAQSIVQNTPKISNDNFFVKIDLMDSMNSIAASMTVEFSDSNMHHKNFLSKSFGNIWKKILRF